jgi:hypothetical protein
VVHEDEMQKLTGLLTTNDIAIISGLPGVGKSSFAAEYGRKQEKNKKVLWIDADNISKVEGEYLALAKQLCIKTYQESPENLRLLVHNEIKKTGAVLFIFDNVRKESYPHLKTYLDNLPKQAKAIITTRHANLDNSPSKKNKLDLQGWTKQEAMQYVKNSDIKQKIKNNEEVEKLVNYWANGDKVLPFDLQGAVKSIQSDLLGGVSDYLDFMHQYPRDEARTELLKKLLSKSELAWKMLQYVSHLDPDFISIDILKELFLTDKNTLAIPIEALQAFSAVEVIWAGGDPGLKMHR